jgi:hypothetical protein
MNTVQRRKLQCKLLLQMNRHPEYAKQLGLVDKSHSQSNQLKNPFKSTFIPKHLK